MAGNELNCGPSEEQCAKMAGTHKFLSLDQLKKVHDQEMQECSGPLRPTDDVVLDLLEKHGALYPGQRSPPSK